MQFMLLIYVDGALADALPEGELDGMLRECFDHVDDLAREGKVLQSHMLMDASQARSLRTRKGRTHALDGPFSETKEVLGGFNLIEARDMDDAVRIAGALPWASIGCIEIRPVQDLNTERRRVGKLAAAAPTS
jgi:hypothetical protein